MKRNDGVGSRLFRGKERRCFLVSFLTHNSSFFILNSLLMFSLFDVILILSVFGFTLFGFWFGLIHTFGALVGTVVAAVVAGQYYTLLPGGAPKVVAFIVIFLVVNRLIGFVFYLLNRIYKIMSIIPFLGSINRLGGVVFGALEGTMIVGLVLIISGQLNLGTQFAHALAESRVAPFLTWAASLLLPLLPRAIETAQGFISSKL